MSRPLMRLARLARFAVLAAAFWLTGCHTIEVVNDQERIDAYEPEERAWNHTGILGLVNYSPDFYLVEMCPRSRRWQAVTTERGGLAIAAELGMGAAQRLLEGIASRAVGVANVFWDPLNVSWRCSSN